MLINKKTLDLVKNVVQRGLLWAYTEVSLQYKGLQRERDELLTKYNALQTSLINIRAYSACKNC